MKNQFEIRGDVTAIFLKRRDGTVLETLIDTDDLPLAQSIPGTWCVFTSGRDKKLYAETNWRRGRNEKPATRLHRFLTSAPKGTYVDHINHDGLDNRRSCNLRVVTNAENVWNRREANRTSKTGVRGVSWNKECRKFAAYVQVNGKSRYLGVYATLEEAEAAVVAARREIEQTLYPSSAAA